VVYDYNLVVSEDMWKKCSVVSVINVGMHVASRDTYLRWTIGRLLCATWDDFMLSVMVFDLPTAWVKNNQQLLAVVGHTSCSEYSKSRIVNWGIHTYCISLPLGTHALLTFELATLLMFLNVNLRLIFSTLPVLPSHMSSPRLRITF